MQAYKTTKCPYCGVKLEIWEPYGVNDYSNNLGEPYGFCLSCGGKYKTGKQRWSQMNFFTKSLVIFKLLFSILLSSVMISTCFFILIIFLKKNFFENSFNWIEVNGFFRLIIKVAIFITPILTFGGIIRLKQEIKEFN